MLFFQTNAKSFPDVAPAVLNTESVHISLNNKTNQSMIPAQMTTSAPAVIEIPTSPAAVAAAAAASANSGLRTIELSTGRVREGFGNCFFLHLFWKTVIKIVFYIFEMIDSCTTSIAVRTN